MGYNASSYDSPRSIELLDGIVDVYMPAIKLFGSGHAHRYPDEFRAVMAVARRAGLWRLEQRRRPLGHLRRR